MSSNPGLGVPGENRPRSGSASGPSGGRRMSKLTDVRGAKSQKPMMDYLYEHFDKATIGLVINFGILIILLMMLKNFMVWFTLPGQPKDGAAGGGDD